MHTPPAFSPITRPARIPRAASGIEITHVRGVIQGMVRKILMRDLDPQAWGAFLASLSPAGQDAIRTEADEYDWVPLAGLAEAVNHHPGGRQRVHMVLEGSVFAEMMMTDKHRWMLKVMTPELMIGQAPRIFSFYHQGGKLTAEAIGPGWATAMLRAKGPSPAWFATLLPAWFKRSLELSGGKAVTVSHALVERDSDLHRYRFTWS